MCAGRLPATLQRASAIGPLTRDRAGSDASGWPFLAVQHEAGGRCVKLGKSGRRQWRGVHHEVGTDEGRATTEGRAVAAMARRPAGRVGGIAVFIAVVMRRSHPVVPLVVTMAVHPQFGPGIRLPARAKHGRGQCAPKGQHHHQQNQQPDSTGFHASKVSTALTTLRALHFCLSRKSGRAV